ncbi:MAG: PQQ-dependent sugar dehydrogenase [Gammaproteobacteria bacterium]
MSNRCRLFAAAAIGLFLSGGLSSAAGAQELPFSITEVARLQEPWAMAFLPDGRLLVTERAGALKLVDVSDGTMFDIAGVPEVAYGNQSGFGDVVLHPDYADNGLVYFTYSEAADDRSSTLTVARATLDLNASGGRLADFEIIWRQSPAVRGGQYGMRIAFGDGYLWVSVGDRMREDPAQDLQQTIGKIVRLNYDGTAADGNPFADQGGVAAEVWTLGHRNPYGLAFDSQGRLWSDEMGPRGGDELNLIERGANYGWPEVSNGTEYSGAPIPDHDTRPEFHAPALFWVPSISPSSLMFYDGDEFPAWRGDAFVGALSAQAIVRVEIDGDTAREAERFPMGARIRGLAQGPDGAIWVIQDGGGPGGRGGRGGGAGGGLLKLTAD